MCQDKDTHKHHSADHGHSHGETNPKISHSELPLFSRKERLIKRLEHDLRHNCDHAASYEKLAAEAMALGSDGAARMIRAAAEHTTCQNKQLEKAISCLRSHQIFA